MSDGFEPTEFHAERAYFNLDKRLALMDQTLTSIKENHLAHIERDMRWVKAVMWGTAVGVIGNLLAILYMLLGN